MAIGSFERAVGAAIACWFAAGACGGRAVSESASATAGGDVGSVAVGGHPGAAGSVAMTARGGAPSGVAGAPMAQDARQVDDGLPAPSQKCLDVGFSALCPLTEADVACRLDTDCTVRVEVECGGTCEQMIDGVNRASTVSCELCQPLSVCNGQFIYLSQDCRVIPAGQAKYAARCVNGGCTSFAEPLGAL